MSSACRLAWVHRSRGGSSIPFAFRWSAGAASIRFATSVRQCSARHLGQGVMSPLPSGSSRDHQEDGGSDEHESPDDCAPDHVAHDVVRDRGDRRRFAPCPHHCTNAEKDQGANDDVESHERTHASVSATIPPVQPSLAPATHNIEVFPMKQTYVVAHYDGCVAD